MGRRRDARRTTAHVVGRSIVAVAVARHLESLRASTLWAPVLAPISSVEVVDPTLVRITLDQPWPELPRLLTGQVGMVVRPGPGGEPVGTGPFRWPVAGPPPEPAQTPVRLVRSPDHWRPIAPLLDAVDVSVAPEPSLYGPWVGNVPDVAGAHDLAVLAPGQAQPAFTEVPQILRSTTAPAGMVLVARPVPPSDDPEVRQLVLRATAWSATRFVDDARLHDAGPTVQAPTDERAMTSSAALVRDVERWEDDHGPLELTLAVEPGKVIGAEAQRLQKHLAGLGIDLTVAVVDGSELASSPAALLLVPTATSAAHAGDPELLSWLAPLEPTTAEARARMLSVEGDAAEAQAAEVDALLRRHEGLVPLWRAPVAVVAAASVHGIVGATTPEGIERSPLDGGVLPWATIWQSS